MKNNMKNNKNQNNAKENNSQNNSNQMQQEPKVDTYKDKDGVEYMVVGINNTENEIEDNEIVIDDDSNEPDDEYRKYNGESTYKEVDNDDDDDEIQNDQYYDFGATQDQTMDADYAHNGHNFNNMNSLTQNGYLGVGPVNGKDVKTYYRSGILESCVNKRNNQLHGECSFYHPNGVLQYQCEFKNGKRNGTGKQYDENGYDDSSIEYKNDVMNGDEMLYHKNLMTAVEGRRKNGMRVGKFKEYDEKGKILKLYNYNKNGNGLLDGEYITFYPKKYGQKKSECYYNNGNRCGIYIERYESGNISKICHYDENGKLTGKCTTYYENGKKKTECTYKNNILVGKYREWHENDKIAKKCYYENGALDGKYIEKYDNGNIAKECNYKNDIIVGEYIEKYDNGNIAKEGFYDNDGKRKGPFTTYYENGDKKSECNYKNNILEGKYREWHKNGNIAKEGNYTNGALYGAYIEYYDDKKIAKECNYENGIIVGKYQEWHDNGKIAKEFSCKNGALNGKYRRLDRNGKLLEEINYVDNLKDGKCIECIGIDNDTVIVKSTYEKGQKNGLCQMFNIKNNKQILECYYTNDKENGPWVMCDSDGNLMMKGLYKDGKQDGEWFYYSADRKAVTKGNFTDGKADGEFITSGTEGKNKNQIISKTEYKNGVEIVVHEHSIANNQNEIILEEKDHNVKNSSSKDGEYNKREYREYNKKYYPNGRLKTLEISRDGQKHSVIITFYENGNVLSMHSYANGHPDGLCTDYYPDGRVQSWAWYSEGVVNKYRFTFNNDGNVIVNQNCLSIPGLSVWKPSEEQKQIIAKLYNGDEEAYLIELNLENDDRHCTKKYKDNEDGKKILVSKEFNYTVHNYSVREVKHIITYNDKGKVESSQIYVDGTLRREMAFDDTGKIKTKVCYDWSGKINKVENYFNKDKNEIWTGRVEDGKLKDGIIKKLSKDGKIVSCYYVSFGRKNDGYREYNNDGQLIYEGYHDKSGKRDGSGVEYSPTLKFPYYYREDKKSHHLELIEAPVPVFKGKYENGMRKEGEEYQLPDEKSLIQGGIHKTYKKNDIKIKLPKLYEGTYHQDAGNHRKSGKWYYNDKNDQEFAEVEYYKNGVIKKLSIENPLRKYGYDDDSTVQKYEYDDDGTLTSLYVKDGNVEYLIEVNYKEGTISCLKYNGLTHHSEKCKFRLTKAMHEVLPKAGDVTSIDKLPKYDDVMTALSKKKSVGNTVAGGDELYKKDKKDDEQEKTDVMDSKSKQSEDYEMNLARFHMKDMQQYMISMRGRPLVNNAQTHNISNDDVAEKDYDNDNSEESYDNDINEEQENTQSKQNENQMMHLPIIPIKEIKQTMLSMRGGPLVNNVQNHNISNDDVTEEYYDNDITEEQENTQSKQNENQMNNGTEMSAEQIRHTLLWGINNNVHNNGIGENQGIKEEEKKKKEVKKEDKKDEEKKEEKEKKEINNSNVDIQLPGQSQGESNNIG